MPRIVERLPARIRGGVPLFRLVHVAIALTAYLYALLGSASIRGAATVLLWTAVMGTFLAWPALVPRTTFATPRTQIRFLAVFLALAAWANWLTRLDFGTTFLFYAACGAAFLSEARTGWRMAAISVAVLYAEAAILVAPHDGGIYAALLPWAVGLAFVGGTIVLYTREGQARTRSEQLLAELEAAHRQLREYAEQVRELATLEERNRLAQELHDSVTQTLFSAALIADVLPRLWAQRPAAAQERLDELRRLTRGALAEMRMLLLELRPAALTQLGLGDLLRQLAGAVGGRSGLAIEVQMEGQRSLPPDVQLALYRIAQEALNNVAKYAGADGAVVRAALAPGRVTLSVQDDGSGFDPAAVPPGHFGLGIMRERAAAIGACLRVESAPARGTTVAVTWAAPEEDAS